MWRQFRIVGWAIVVTLAVEGPLRAEVTAEQVRQAIENGVAYLKARQHAARGNWNPHPSQPGGVTALCALALLNSGVAPDDPVIRRAMRHLQQLDQDADNAMTYSTSLQIMVYCAADPDQYRPFIHRNAQWLERMQIRTGPRSGAWGYSSRQGRGDNSNTQFALLALHEAERAGVKVDPETWKRALDYWLRTQRPDGAWGYFDEQPATGSMTCAGIASVIIASGQLSSDDAQVINGRVRCCGNQADEDPVRRALDWLGKKFTVRTNPSAVSNLGLAGQTWLYYYLYGVERVGRLTGQRFIGNHDWYREGAEYLVGQQDGLTSYWKGYGHTEDDPNIATALALLFLSKGRRPVVISKYMYGDPEDRQADSARNWDRHRNGVRNLTRSIETRWKRELTWQSIDARAATADDLLETPVLFISGRDELRLTAEQKENLKDYISRGGFIFAEACCGGKEFDRSFRELVAELFPDNPLRLLPPDHAVWFAEGKVDPQYMRPLYGIDACCRTSVVYCPEDLSCYWELHWNNRDVDYPRPVRDEIEACVRTGQNVVAYATNRVLKDKLDRPQARRSEIVEQLERGMLYVPKLQHEGGSDDAPNALPNLLRFVKEKTEMRVNTSHSMISPNDPAIFDYPIVYMHGRRGFRFNASERKTLATYVRRGGLIVADSICASEEFNESFRREMKAILPVGEMRRIPPDHELFSREFGGFDLSSVTLRDPKLRAGDDAPLEARLAKVSPLLEGITIDGRLGVILSPNDLSCALENHASLECRGYVKTDAARIGLNLILFGLQQ